MKEENEDMNLKSDGHLDENSLALCAEWLSGKKVELPPEIKEHIKICSSCKDEALEISELIEDGVSFEMDETNARDMFEETCAAKNSPSIKPVSGNHFWRVAAILILLITVTSIAIFVGSDKKELVVADNDPTETVVGDSVNRDTQEESEDSKPGDIINKTEGVEIESVEKDLYAENFVPNPGLEALINAQFRSGEKPEVTRPGKDTTMLCGRTLIYSLINPKQEELEIQILDNKGELKQSKTVKENLTLAFILDLDPGIYYWKLLTEDEMCQVGKIILKEEK